ncbi:MAG: hypothetical protein U0263_15170 [Polyangiaceae bacterium]
MNDGMIEVVTQDRGVEYLNKLDEANGAYAGVSPISDGDARPGARRTSGAPNAPALCAVSA